MKRVAVQCDCVTKRQRVVELPSFVVVFDMIFRQKVTNVMPHLLAKDLYSLAVCSKEMFLIMKKTIEEKLWFDASSGPWKHFTPTNIIFGQCFEPPILPQHIPFGAKRIVVEVATAHIPDLPPTINSIFLNGHLHDYTVKLTEGLKVLGVGPFFGRLSNLPSTLVSLRILSHAKCKIKISAAAFDSLPEGLKELKFDASIRYDHPLDRLPSTLDTLKLPDGFDQPIDHLPVGLKTLTLGSYFNRSVDRLPDGLEKLSLCTEFDRPVDRLPAGLKVLSFDDHFDRPIDNLPKGLEKLVLGYAFNHPANNLPDSLKTLVFGRKFRHPLEKIPASLTKLSLHPRYTLCIANVYVLQRLFNEGWSLPKQDENYDGLVTLYRNKCEK